MFPQAKHFTVTKSTRIAFWTLGGFFALVISLLTVVRVGGTEMRLEMYSWASRWVTLPPALFGFEGKSEVDYSKIAIPAAPSAPSGYEVRVVAQGGALANRHLSGIAIDPNTGNIYVSTDGNIIPAPPNYHCCPTSSSFNLLRVSPNGSVTSVGSYPFGYQELANLEWGPDGNIYVVNGNNSSINQINPTTGATSVFNSNAGFGNVRHGLEFDPAGNLIISPEAVTEFFKVNVGSGRTFLGSYSPDATFNHGDRFGIKPDGNYVVYSDSSTASKEFQVLTAGHVIGTPFTFQYLSSTDVRTLGGSGYVHSNGAIHPVTGDVYSSGGNGGAGSSVILYTPGNSGPTATTAVFVSNIGNGLTSGPHWPSSDARGVTDLDFGPRTDGQAGHSLFYLDDFTDTIYEVRQCLLNINTPPVAQQVCEGGAASFTVAATGSGLSYQWRKGTSPLSNSGNISGATSATLMINPATAADVASDYNVVITNSCTSVTSNSVALTVNPLPSATITPMPTQVCAGSTGNQASGPAGLSSYAWTITNGTITNGANSQTVTYTAGTSGNVTLMLSVTNANSCANSSSTDVTINANPAPPTITPATPFAAPNSTGQQASGPAGLSSYAWMITNGTITNGANSQTVTYTAGATGNVVLQLTVTNTPGCSASNSLTLPINVAPVISKAFAPSYTVPNTTTTLTFTITNPATNAAAFTGASFTDTFPNAPNLVVANPPNVLFNNCGGSAVLTDNTAGGLNAGDVGVKLSGATVAVGTSCTVSVNVMPVAQGPFENVSGNVTAFNGGTGNTATATLSTNQPPQITAIPLTRKAGSQVGTVPIASVGDTEDTPTTLSAKINNSSSVTLNGITVTILSITAGGQVQANITTDCAAMTTTFTLSVIDSAGVTITTPWTVMIEPNQEPSLAYGSPQTVAAGGALNVSPTTASDNGTVTYSILSVVPPLNVVPTVDGAGVVAINSANPAGAHVITVQATDKCNATTQAMFTLNVTPGAATHFVVSAPASATLGTGFNFTVTAQDVFNNTATGYGGTVHFTSSDGVATLPANSTLTSGVSMFSATLNTVSNQTLTATDTVTGSITGTSGNIFVSLAMCPSTLTINDLGDTTDNNPGNGVCNDGTGKCTLRAALVEANMLGTAPCSPLTINFSVTGTINLGAALPNLNHPNLMINGPGANQLNVRRNVAAPFRIFWISSGRTVALSGMSITNGNATGADGGGIYSSGHLTLTNCTLSGNQTDGEGGAVYATSNGSLTLTGCTLSGNTAQQGGGLSSGAAVALVVNVTNTTISGNTATLMGGGIDLSDPATTLNLLNVTLANNQATISGGGINQSAGTINLKNTLVSGNNAPSGTDLSGTVNSQDYNLLGSASGATITGTTTHNILNTNALLAPLGNYGGPTQTQALLPGSPAINAGTATGATANDQRGVARVGNVDIGAVEAQAFALAITGGNNQNTVVNTAFPGALQVNLKEGANNLPGAVITFTGPGSGASLNPVSGTATTDANGNASRNLTANTVAGGPYTVAATTGALSQPFSLTHLPGVPAQLAFGQQPTNTAASSVITPAVTVRVLDGFGNLTPSSAAITLALGANPGGATLSGTLTVNAINSVAFFNTLSLNKLSTGYTLVANSPGLTGTTSLPFNTNCPLITLSNLAAGTAGTAYNQTVTALPAGGAYSFALTGGTLPPGLSFAPNGTLSGTPSMAGTFNFTLTASGFTAGAGSCTGTQTYILTINCPALTLTPATLANGVQGGTYNQTVAAGPAGTTYSYAVTAGALPPGLTLNNSTGALTGTLTAAGNYAFAITATGWGTCAKSQSYNIFVTGVCEPITIAPTTLPSGTLGATYNQNLTATSGVAPHTFSVSSGALPAGLSLSSSGTLTGTPQSSGTFIFTVKATALGGCAATRNYVLTVTCAPLTFSPATLPNGTAGISYTQTLSVSPGNGYTFSLLLGGLPPGLTLSNAGVLSGVTSQIGTYHFTVKALGGICQGTKAYTLVINANAAALAQQADYNGDGRSDFALWSASGTWRLALSNDTQRQMQTLNWGTKGDLTLLGDYDGDGQTDLAVFRPANGTWYVKHSSDGSTFVKAWGMLGDVPLPGDYDGDSKTDLAVFRPSEGNWYVLHSANQQYSVTAWGAGYAPYNDVAVPGDYDGDGKTDLAVFRRATGTWLINRSRDGQASVKAWGLATDTPVAADYDGDGQTDLAVWRQGMWYVWRSGSQSAHVAAWGSNAAPYFDQSMPGDYDGDGKADYTVWRASEQTWFVQCSRDGSLLTQTHGETGDSLVAGKN